MYAVVCIYRKLFFIIQAASAIHREKSGIHTMMLLRNLDVDVPLESCQQAMITPALLMMILSKVICIGQRSATTSVTDLTSSSKSSFVAGTGCCT